MIIITLDDMKIAFEKTLGEKGMSKAETDELAEYVMSFFGFKDILIDNRLTSKDRDIFYKLENEGLLTTDNEEATLKRGKRWRIHYWVLNKREIVKLSRGEEEAPEDDQYLVYDFDDDEMWARGDDSE